ncbi:MAG: hypothetical protein P8Y29_07695, partial [Gemmatimonadota bacterium]
MFFKGGPFTETGTGGPIFSGQGLDDFFVSTDPADVGNFPEVCTVDQFRQEQFPSLGSFAGEPFPGFADITVCTASNDITIGTCGTCGGLRVGVEVVEVAFQFSVPAVQDFTFFALRIFNRTEFLNAGNSPLQPAGPYDLTDVSVAYAIDPDLGEAGDDQIAFFPDVQTMTWWDSDFSEPQFQNPPGIGGVTYLKTPVDPATGEEVGLAEFTVFTNGNPRPDPLDKETWYALMLGDPAEVVLEVDPRDIRGMASSALFPLPAGEFVEIYAAIFFADISGSPPAQLLAEAYKNLATGELVPDANDDPIFDNFRLVQQTAQATFDAGFVVPTAPPKPGVTLNPGDGQVTIVWDGAPVANINPFAKVARDPFARLGDGTPDPDADPKVPIIILEADDEIFDPSRDVGGLSGFVTAETAGLTGQVVTNAAFNLDFVIQDFQGFNVYRSFTGIADDAELIAQFDAADGVTAGLFCTSAQAVFDVADDGAFVTTVCTQTTTLNIGSDAGLGFAVIDRGGNFPDPSTGPGLLNGIPISYAVTAFAVNPGQSTVTLPTQEALDVLNSGPAPAAPLVLESGLSPLLSATPRSNASSFIDATIGGASLLDGTGTPLTGNDVDLPLDANGALTGPIPGARDFDVAVNIINPLAIPTGFEARIVIDDATVGTEFFFANYDTAICGCGFGAAFDLLPGIDPRGRIVEFHIEDGNGSILQTPEGEARASALTDFISFTGVSNFSTGTLSVLAPEDPSLGVAFTVSWSSAVGNRSTQCARA